MAEIDSRYAEQHWNECNHHFWTGYGFLEIGCLWCDGIRRKLMRDTFVFGERNMKVSLRSRWNPLYWIASPIKRQAIDPKEIYK